MGVREPNPSRPWRLYERPRILRGLRPDFRLVPPSPIALHPPGLTTYQQSCGLELHWTWLGNEEPRFAEAANDAQWPESLIPDTWGATEAAEAAVELVEDK
jgi:hypothetical protein